MASTDVLQRRGRTRRHARGCAPPGRRMPAGRAERSRSPRARSCRTAGGRRLSANSANTRWERGVRQAADGAEDVAARGELAGEALETELGLPQDVADDGGAQRLGVGRRRARLVRRPGRPDRRAAGRRRARRGKSRPRTPTAPAGRSAAPSGRPWRRQWRARGARRRDTASRPAGRGRSARRRRSPTAPSRRSRLTTGSAVSFTAAASAPRPSISKGAASEYSTPRSMSEPGSARPRAYEPPSTTAATPAMAKPARERVDQHTLTVGQGGVHRARRRGSRLAFELGDQPFDRGAW